MEETYKIKNNQFQVKNAWTDLYWKFITNNVFKLGSRTFCTKKKINIKKCDHESYMILSLILKLVRINNT